MIAATVDFRQGLPTVGYQGLRPACLAFAASSAHQYARGSTASLSIEFLHFHSVQRSPGADPKAGVTMQAMSEAIDQDGQPEEAAWPYELAQPPAAVWIPPAAPSKLFYADTATCTNKASHLIAELDLGHAVVLGLVITDRFRHPDAEGRVAVETGDRPRGGHAVLAVGHGSATDGAYVLIRNSWGPAWGINGHAWLSEAYLNAQLRDAAVLSKRG